MATIAEIRSQYPQYQDLSDEQLAGALHQKFYSDMPLADFQAKVGLSVAPPVADDPAIIAPTLHDAATGVGQGITLGFGDEIMAGMAAPFRAGYNKLTGGEFDLGSAYDTELEGLRGRLKQSKERSPIASTVGEITGAMALGGAGAAGAAPVKATYPAMMGRGAATGAAYGGAYGFGTGEGTEDRLGGAAKGATVGAVTGGALGAVGARQASKAARKAAHDADAFRAAKDAAYQQVDKMGARYHQRAFDKLVDDIDVLTQADKLNPMRHPKATSMIEELRKAKGTSPTLTQLDQWRQVIRRDVAGDAAEGHFAGKMLDKIDDFVANAGPKDMFAGNARAANEAIVAARKANSTWRKAETLEDVLTRAERKAARAGSGGNIDNAIRQEVDAILRNPKKSRVFSKEERAAMDRLVRGGKMQNFARWLGKMSPEGNGLSLLLHGLIGGPAAFATGGTSAFLQVPMAMGGAAAKRYADAATPANLAALQKLVTGGKASPQISAQARKLLEAMTRGTVAATP